MRAFVSLRCTLTGASVKDVEVLPIPGAAHAVTCAFCGVRIVIPLNDPGSERRPDGRDHQWSPIRFWSPV